MKQKKDARWNAYFVFSSVDSCFIAFPKFKSRSKIIGGMKLCT